MPHIEQEFHVPRRAELVPEAEHRNTQRCGFAPGIEALEQDFAQRMDCMVRSIDHLVGQCARAFHDGAFGADGVEQTLAAIGGGGAPAFPSTPPPALPPSLTTKVIKPP